MSQLAFAQRSASAPDGPRKVLLIGNPNVGKSLLFTRLTNRYVTVSNYPGTTVEITTAKAEIGGELFEVIDTPGTNGLTPQSNDERVARDILLALPDAHVIQVGDISNLRRTLLLSLQLAEHEIAFTLCLNMSDEARAQAVDTVALEEALGVPVIATSALKRWNIEKLKAAARQPRYAKVGVAYGEGIESAAREIVEFTGDSRGAALSTLSDVHGYDIATARMGAVDTLVAAATEQQGRRRDQHRFTNWLGAVAMHRVWGVPILLGVLYVAWIFVGKFGAGICVDFFQNTVFGEYLNPWA
ncbi:MAG TPA: FeoB small GTPase domain-containing protein, partial [Thermoanaerobaculia bacterium]|nr:FeoB small GTPase domain-containing protein [Thermoanaerobaculia bacterium]